MRVTNELAEMIIKDGGSSCIEAAMEKKAKLASQMDLDLSGNNSGKLSGQIKMVISFTIDKNSRQVETEGTCGYDVPNIKHSAGKKTREIPDPNQPAICGNCGKPDCQLCTKDPETIETGNCNPDDEE